MYTALGQHPSQLLPGMIQEQTRGDVHYWAAKPEHIPVIVNAIGNNWALVPARSKWELQIFDYHPGATDAGASLVKAVSAGMFVVAEGNPFAAPYCDIDPIFCTFVLNFVNNADDAVHLARATPGVQAGAFLLYDPSGQLIVPKTPLTPPVEQPPITETPPVTTTQPTAKAETGDGRLAGYLIAAGIAVVVAGSLYWLRRG